MLSELFFLTVSTHPISGMFPDNLLCSLCVDIGGIFALVLVRHFLVFPEVVPRHHHVYGPCLSLLGVVEVMLRATMKS